MIEKKSLLIIEDHETLRLILVKWLKDLFPHTEIYEASSGEEGLSFLNNVQPNIVIVDIGLPGIDGLEVTKQIKSKNLKTKVIVLTILEGVNYRDDSYKLGAHLFIQKQEMYKILPPAIESILSV